MLQLPTRKRNPKRTQAHCCCHGQQQSLKVSLWLQLLRCRRWRRRLPQVMRNSHQKFRRLQWLPRRRPPLTSLPVLLWLPLQLLLLFLLLLRSFLPLPFRVCYRPLVW